MTEFGEDSGANPRPLWPSAWRYYDGIMATLALFLILLNVLSLSQFSWDKWLNVAIALIAAVAIWLRRRAWQLGIAMPAIEVQRLAEDNERLDAALARVTDDNDRLRRAVVGVVEASTPIGRRRALDHAQAVLGTVAEHEISEHLITGDDSRPPDGPGRHSADPPVG